MFNVLGEREIMMFCLQEYSWFIRPALRSGFSIKHYNPFILKI